MNHHPTAAQERRFQILLEHLFDESLTEAEDVELAQLIEEYPLFRKAYVDQVWYDNLLGWSHATSCCQADEPLEADVAPVTGRLKAADNVCSPVVVSSGASSSNSHHFAWIATSLACLLLLLGFSVLTSSAPDAPKWAEQDLGAAGEQTHIAVLLDSEDAVWGRSRGEIRYGTRLYPGEKLVLKSGLARLAFNCGAGVVLQGPARLELLTEWRAVLHRGTFAAVVPDGAQGFTILTPDMEVQDLGTKFGAVVNESGQTEVQVYEGEVKLQARHPDSGMTPLYLRADSQPYYPQLNRRQNEITVAAVDSRETVSVPTLEQLKIATTGQYPPRMRTIPLPDVVKHPLPAWNQLHDPALPANALIGETFEFSPSFDGSALTHDWIVDDKFARLVFLETPLSWGRISGGHHAIELDGRDPAFPSVCPRLAVRLPQPLKEDFWFSFLGRYQGLDDGDFFGLWFDNNANTGLSHSATPNAGIRFGKYFARANFSSIVELDHPEDDTPFFLVGHVKKDDLGQFSQLSLWVNPDLDSLGDPDLVSQLDPETRGARKFTWMGIRMGKETELSDRLWLDRMLIGATKEDVLLAESGASPSELISPALIQSQEGKDEE